MDNRRLQTELDDLRERLNVTLDQLTADEIAELVDACRRVDNPYGDFSATLMDRPAAVVKGVEFYPLTVGASIWLDEYADRWWGDDNTCYFWALCYAMTHAQVPAAFADLTTEAAARRAIFATCIRFAFSRRAVEEAIDRALGRIDPPEETDDGTEGAKSDWLKIVSRLETQSGIAKDDWLWGRSAAYTVKSYYDLHAFAERYHPVGGGARVFDELDKAINALARLKNRIKCRLEGGK